MEALNRVALIVRPKRRYKEWADAVAETEDDPTFDLDEARTTPAVYLVAAPAELSLQDLIDEYAAEIFEEQLLAWHTDESDWPVNRSPHVFRDWFDVGLGETVVDLDPDEPLDFDDEPFGIDDEGDGLIDMLRGVPDATAGCAWCAAPIEKHTPVVSVSLKGPRASHPEPELIELPFAGRLIQAVVPSDESPAGRDGVMAFVMFCSDECGQAFRVAWQRERDALTS